MNVLCFNNPAAKPAATAVNNNPAAAKIQRLQAQRASRLKHLGRTVVRTLKHVDDEARDLVVQDIRDLAALATELVQKQTPQPAPEAEAEAEPRPEDANM